MNQVIIRKKRQFSYPTGNGARSHKRNKNTCVELGASDDYSHDGNDGDETKQAPLVLLLIIIMMI